MPAHIDPWASYQRARARPAAELDAGGDAHADGLAPRARALDSLPVLSPSDSPQEARGGVRGGGVLHLPRVPVLLWDFDVSAAVVSPHREEEALEQNTRRALPAAALDPGARTRCGAEQEKSAPAARAQGAAGDRAPASSPARTAGVDLAGGRAPALGAEDGRRAEGAGGAREGALRACAEIAPRAGCPDRETVRGSWSLPEASAAQGSAGARTAVQDGRAGGAALGAGGGGLTRVTTTAGAARPVPLATAARQRRRAALEQLRAARAADDGAPAAANLVHRQVPAPPRVARAVDDAPRFMPGIIPAGERAVMPPLRRAAPPAPPRETKPAAGEPRAPFRETIAAPPAAPAEPVQPRLAFASLSEEETRVRASVISNLLALPGWYSRLPYSHRRRRTEELVDRFAARHSVRGALAWCHAILVPEIAATLTNAPGWLRTHLAGYSRTVGWRRVTKWHAALNAGDLEGARAAFRTAQRKKAATAAEQAAELEQAQQLLAWRQAVAADAEVAALLGGVRESISARSRPLYEPPVPDLSRL
jgi:hypothetical protein